MPLPHAAGSIGRRTPLLLVGGADDPEAPPKIAQRLFARLRAGWLHPSEGAEGEGSEERGTHAEATGEQTLHVLPGRGQAMVGSAGEAKLLMEFFARHLALNSALEDDPSIIRVS